MDGGVSGTAPAFDERRWRSQFATAQLHDSMRDWRSQPQGPEQVLAAMRAAPAQAAGAAGTIAWGQVDIYLSAGPVERNGEEIVRSCTSGNVVNCTLWRIRWDFALRRPISIEKVREAQSAVSDTWCTGGVGYFMPAVSPSGRGLAYVAACFETIGASLHHVRSGIDVWKFGEWCGWARYVVVTMYCTDDRVDADDPEDLRVLSSRVMLIDLGKDDAVGTGNADAYIDLTSFLEAHEDATLGSWHGWFATCGPVEGQ